MDIILLEAEEQMEIAIENLKGQLAKISTGRATPAMVENVLVEYYGELTPIGQISAISIQEGRQIVIKPYDKESVKDIDAAIRKADLGFNPSDEGTQLRINVPPLTEETRKKHAKEASVIAEQAKVNIRQARQSANDAIKKEEGPEDLAKSMQEQVQKLTDKFNKIIDELRDEKEASIMTI